MDHLPRQSEFPELVDLFPIIPIAPAPDKQYAKKQTEVFISNGQATVQRIRSLSNDPLVLASLIQSWLYFQLLADFLCRVINTRDFVQNDRDGNSYLHTLPLADVLRQWRSNFLSLPRTVQRWKTLHELRRLSAAAETCAELKKLEQLRGTAAADVVLSVQVLIATLHSSLGIHRDHGFDNLKGSAISLSHLRPLRHTMEMEFVARGWCPHQVREIWDSFSCHTAPYLLSLRRRPRPGRDHRRCFAHTRCAANSVNNKLYELQHAEELCACHPIATLEQDVVRMIKEGGVPLVSATHDPSTGQLRLSIVKRTPRSRYIALSHVWADGLGNPFGNALTSCLLKQILTLLSRLPRSHNAGRLKAASMTVDWARLHIGFEDGHAYPLFWMDTLCVPVSKENDKYKVESINQMASIYAAAEQVLILDSELQTMKISNRSPTEILARILCSTWMTRSWTFQEGALARECVFQFADSAIDPINEWSSQGLRDPKKGDTPMFGASDNILLGAIHAELYDHVWLKLHQTGKSNLRRNGTWQSLTSRDVLTPEDVQNLQGAKRLLRTKPSRYAGEESDYYLEVTGHVHRVRQLVMVWNELASRSTTKPEDLHVIIANLLDYSAAHVLEIKNLDDTIEHTTEETKARRMRSILLSFHALPVSMLYLVGSPLQPSGLRWIPTAPEPGIQLAPVGAWMEVHEREIIVHLAEPDPLGKVYLTNTPIATLIGSHIRDAASADIFMIADRATSSTYQADFSSAQYAAHCFLVDEVDLEKSRHEEEVYIKAALFGVSGFSKRCRSPDYPSGIFCLHATHIRAVSLRRVHQSEAVDLQTDAASIIVNVLPSGVGTEPQWLLNVVCGEFPDQSFQYVINDVVWALMVCRPLRYKEARAPPDITQRL